MSLQQKHPDLSPSLLAALSRRRWSLPVLAALHERDGGAKFVTLARALDVNQGSLREALAHLIELGLVTPNPGDGHPLRPEYLLTTPGERVSPWARKLHGVIVAAGDGAADIALRRWSLPALAHIGALGGGVRFRELAERIHPVTDRALSICLKGLEHASLIRREVAAARPVVIRYWPGEKSRPILTILQHAPAL